MKKNLLPFLAFSLFISMNTCIGQITFQKSYGESVWEIGLSSDQTSDKGYIMGGYTYSPSGDMEFYIVKTDTEGTIEWSNAYGGFGDDAARCVRQVADGEFLAIGTTTSFGVTGYDVYVIKTNSLGDTIWTRTYGTGVDDIGYNGVQTNDGGFIITGTTGSDIYLIRTDPNGDTLWTKKFGGSGTEVGTAVQQTRDSGYIVVGYTNSYGTGQNDVFLIKTDKNGNISWAKTYGENNRDEGYNVEQTNDDGYIVTGTTFSFGAESVYLIKTDVNGVLSWSYTYGGGFGDDGFAVRQAPDKGYVLCGTTFSFSTGTGGDVYLIRTDSLGNEEWSYNYGGLNYDYGYSIYPTSDNGYVMAGYTQSFGSGGYDCYLIKTDSTGATGCFEAIAPTSRGAASTQVTTIPNFLSGSGATVGYTNTFVNAHGVESTACYFVGIKEELNNKTVGMSIAPNPSSGKFTINLNDLQLKQVHLEILNTFGEMVLQKNIFGELETKIDLSNASPGLYFVRVSDGKITSNKKIVIQ